jgi:hypothetical protein
MVVLLLNNAVSSVYNTQYRIITGNNNREGSGKKRSWPILR